jgi:hypothetical protein
LLNKGEELYYIHLSKAHEDGIRLLGLPTDARSYSGYKGVEAMSKLAKKILELNNELSQVTQELYKANKELADLRSSDWDYGS